MVVGVKTLCLTFERGRGLWWVERVVVGVKPVRLAFQVREGWMVGGAPPSRSEGGVVGRLSPPSLET